jgi:hypothetical protein
LGVKGFDERFNLQGYCTYCLWCANSQTNPIATYHHCTYVNGTTNVSGYQTMTEVYRCDEGDIELGGGRALRAKQL